MHNLNLHGKKYPVTVDGTGPLPCVCLGIGTLLQRTLSKNFKKHFTTHSTDLYWVESARLVAPETLTIKQIVDDIYALLTALQLPKAILVAHSCFGILALEAAKRQFSAIQGIILVASPPCWNQESIAFANDYFTLHASPERKANDRIRKAHFQKIRTPNESELSLNTYESCGARYWGNFDISREYLTKLWDGIAPDEAITNHFYLHLLPQHDLAADIEKIAVPVALAAGHLDFDSAPLALWQKYPKPPNFKVIDCQKVGHWPHLENPQFFDTEIAKWADTI
jgi:pimeloyl-ACP methyl ester carboxylesterase